MSFPITTTATTLKMVRLHYLAGFLAAAVGIAAVVGIGVWQDREPSSTPSASARRRANVVLPEPETPQTRIHRPRAGGASLSVRVIRLRILERVDR
jgi:hypothetical protein